MLRRKERICTNISAKTLKLVSNNSAAITYREILAVGGGSLLHN
jgi:hypothetical protein